MCPGGAQRVQIGVWILALADFDVRILRARPLTGAGVGLHVQCTPARTRPGCAVAACAQMHAHAHARQPGRLTARGSRVHATPPPVSRRARALRLTADARAIRCSRDCRRVSCPRPPAARA